MLRTLLTRTAIRPRAAGALRSFAKPAATAAPAAEVSRFPGAATAFTTTMDIQAPQSKRPVFRVMNEQGKILIPNYVDKVKNWSHACFFQYVLPRFKMQFSCFTITVLDSTRAHPADRQCDAR